jgi:hypothetical protein
MADDVSLPDLEVISRFSLALRTATASREDVVAALEADLAWLRGRAPRAPAGTAVGRRAAPSTSAARRA